MTVKELLEAVILIAANSGLDSDVVYIANCKNAVKIFVAPLNKSAATTETVHVAPETASTLANEAILKQIREYREKLEKLKKLLWILVAPVIFSLATTLVLFLLGVFK